MRFNNLLFMCAPNKLIKNIHLPSCKNCIYYKPYNGDFTSALSRCEKFGEKNIVHDEIKYDYADSSRNNNEKCGFDGKYFYQEPNMNLKIIKNKIIKNKIFIFITGFLFLYVYIIIKSLYN